MLQNCQVAEVSEVAVKSSRRIGLTRSCIRGARRCRGVGQPHELKEKGVAYRRHQCPSRASTLVNYVRLDKGLIGYVFEIAGSLKIGKCMTTRSFFRGILPTSWHRNSRPKASAVS